MKTFVNGLGLIIPTAVVLYLFVWILKSTESLFGDLLVYFLPEEYYITGLGFVVGIAFVFFVGLLLKLLIVQKLRDLIENIIAKTPLISTVYGAIKDFFHFFARLKSKKEKIVVLVDMPILESKMIGFVTLDSLKEFEELQGDDAVVVYLQLSYQIGGYSLLIPKKNITPIDMGIEDAMQFVMTAGISTKANPKKI